MKWFSGLPSIGDLVLMAANNTSKNLAGIAAAWTSAGVVTACSIAGLLWLIMTLWSFPNESGVQLQASVNQIAKISERSEQKIEALVKSQAENAFQIRLLTERMERLHPLRDK